ncbi:hypothetical protein DOTSEDRAFT_24778 [Dothistroma septosporum NZE10]|uniref:Cupin 2 conserved barrel domain-containing protein n=1 Tax=Dothistroma septosporum (strain NZE10 / CBS 128990) TaxID=675120 RepID=N1PQU7_DOTSN|nr:hypothetical protein DOTSEDRAFT_24778 [Dothistroma septosporum NZE10]
MSNVDLQKTQKVIAGPYTLFDGSIKAEYLQDDDLDATFLIRMTITGGHALIDKRKSHPISPPLHLHFDQAETFKVLQGKWGVTAGYEQRDIILMPEDEAFTIPTWLPHTPWPVPTEEDSIILAWGHPKGVLKPMDVPFFEQIFLYIGECFEEKKNPDLLQMMLSQ